MSSLILAEKFLDCTLRDGGYYNAWNFSSTIVEEYLIAMSQLGVDIVELGLRSLKVDGFSGPNAYTTDDYIRTLDIPDNLTVAVMINAAELFHRDLDLTRVLERLFPEPAGVSPVQLVRIASHVHEFQAALPACAWLKERGFQVGFNLMQVADRSQVEIEALATEAAKWPLDVLYFADSMGSMTPDQTAEVVGWLRKHWNGPLGIHTHDNMGLALQNTLRALNEGVTWLDATVTGMGRGPGNAQTEQLALELAERRGGGCNIVPLMGIIRDFFQPMQQRCGWGTNPYYYLAGKYGIHPSYIQEMMGDSRYSDEDIIAVIEHLRVEGGKKFSLNTLDAARTFYQGPPRGSWCPAALVDGRDVLVLGAGPGVAEHKDALERYIRKAEPFVMALNTQSKLAAELIDVRVACHPVRLLADCQEHTRLPQPLVTPASMLPADVRAALAEKELLDFGMGVQADEFTVEATHCVLPTSLVFAYALAVACSGRARRIYLAGFDGYGADDPRSVEVQRVLSAFEAGDNRPELCTVTPSRYTLNATSIYAM